MIAGFAAGHKTEASNCRREGSANEVPAVRTVPHINRALQGVKGCPR